LTIARLVQGAGAASVWTVGFTLCFDTVGSENLGKTIGTVSNQRYLSSFCDPKRKLSACSQVETHPLQVMGFVQVGAVVSPPLGGIIYSQAGIGALAAVSTGILLLDLLMRILLIEKKVAARYVHIEPFIANGASAQSPHEPPSDNSEGSSHTEESRLLPSEDALDEYFLPSTENRILQSMPILQCLGNSSLVTAITLFGIQSAVLSSFDATISLQAYDMFNFGSLEAGLFFVPLCCLRLVAAPIGGWAVDRYGPKPISVLGNVLLAPVLVALRLVKAEPRATQIALYCVLLGLAGLCKALIGPPTFIAAGAVVKRYHQRNPELFGENGPIASMYGLNLMTFSIGLTVGPIVAGGLRDRYVQAKNPAFLAIIHY
jgi:MFS family permease